MHWVDMLPVSDKSKHLIRVWILFDRIFVAAVTAFVTCLLLAIALTFHG